MKLVTSKKVTLFLTYLGRDGAERARLNLAEGLAYQGLQADCALLQARGSHLHKVLITVRIIDLVASWPCLSLSNLARCLRTENPLALISGIHYANEIAVVGDRRTL